MSWVYHRPGEPLWEWDPMRPGEPEQAVLFYSPGAPFSGGFPPMTDAEWDRLKEGVKKSGTCPQKVCRRIVMSALRGQGC